MLVGSMNELYLVPSVTKYVLPILHGKKTDKASFRKNAQSFFDFPCKQGRQVLISKAVAIQASKHKEKSEKIGISALSPHTDVLQFLISKNSPTSENSFIPFQLNKCRIFIGFHYFLSTCDIYINYESFC